LGFRGDVRSMRLVVVLSVVALAAASAGGAGQKDACRDSGGACAKPQRDSMLLQIRYGQLGAFKASAMESAAKIESGDIVFLKVLTGVPHNASRWVGNRVTVMPTGDVHAKWDHTGAWQQITIEREAGPGPVQSGDAVFLWSHWKKALTVNEISVTAKSAEKSDASRFIIETRNGSAIVDGASVFFKAHTGNRMDVRPEDKEGVVQANFTDMGLWQEIVLERKAPPATTTESPDVTTEAPMTDAPATSAPCVAEGSLGKCQPCLKSEQCGGGRYCDPYMKKCVRSSNEPCYVPIAQCEPMCWDSLDNADCTCKNANFPSNWQRPTCMGSAPPTTVTPTTTMAALDPTKVSAKAWEHFVLINALRSSGYTCPGGVTFPPNTKPLRFDCNLWKASHLHSKDMADKEYLSHYSLDGRSPWRRARDQNTTANAENIGAGHGLARGTLELFRDSEAHCKNMMNPLYEVAAVGYAAGGYYRHYWTQMFRKTGDVERWCYPTLALAQASGEDAHAHEGQKVLGEGWMSEGVDETTTPPPEAILDPWVKK